MQQHPDGLLETHVSLATPAEVPSEAAREDDAEGFDMGMAIDGASHHDTQGAVFGSEGSMIGSGVDDERGTRLNQPAGLLMKAAGQTRQQSSTPTADHGERAVYGTFLEPVNKAWVKPGRAARCPSHRKDVSRRERGDDQMTDPGAVPCLESLQLANEAKVKMCVPQPVSVAVGHLVQFQQQAARLAAEGCDAGMTDRRGGEGEREGDGGRSGGVDPVGHRYERRFTQPKCVVMATHRRKNWSRARA